MLWSALIWLRTDTTGAFVCTVTCLSVVRSFETLVVSLGTAAAQSQVTNTSTFVGSSDLFRAHYNLF
jgi:hypothetical protein